MTAWKPITDFPDYEVSNDGRVRFLDGKKFCRRLHRLIAKAFIPNPENKPTVNHVDGNRINNSLNNLEWATVAEQNLHKCRVLKKNIGETCPGAKLTAGAVVDIRNDKRGYGLIAKDHKVSKSTVGRVKQGIGWRHVH